MQPTVLIATFVALIACGVAPMGAAVAQPADPEFTADFPLKGCNFQSVGGNPYFKLVVGRQLYLNNQRCVNEGQCEEFNELWITVLPEVRRVTVDTDGRRLKVSTRVVEEFETEDGDPKELSRNFYADCRPGHDVYYFGEEVSDGEGNPLPDAWLAGEGENRPGVIMPGGAFLLGARYFQEVAPGVALDRAEHIAQGILVDVPAGAFENCVQVAESTPLEPGQVSTKTYCPGVGLVEDGELQLVDIFMGQRSRRNQIDNGD